MFFESNKYQLLIDNLEEGFTYNKVVTDKKGRPIDCIILKANSAFEKITGLSRDRVVGRKATEVYGLADSDFDWVEACGRAAFAGESFQREKYLKSTDTYFDVTAYSDEYGYFVELFRHVDAEEKLRKSGITYRELVENINEVIYVLDENANITYVSPNVETISGYSPAELAEMRFTELVHPDDLEGRIEQFLKIMSGVNEASEYRFITKNGQVVWVRTAARPIIRNGRAVGVQGVLADITERKQVEERLSFLSFYDALTGLYNRFYWEEQQKRLDTHRQHPLGLIMADVNGLKLVNDTYGHYWGDEMLKHAAEILKASCRKEDVISRWGGDEFMILLPQTSEREVKEICERIKSLC